MHVLLDTNVILDVLLDREPWVASAKEVWLRVEAGEIQASLGATTLTNVFYIVRKAKGIAVARTAVGDLLKTFSVCTVDGPALKSALGKPMNDYEDALQDAAAELTGIATIVTRNKLDFAGSSRRIIDAAELVAELNAAGRAGGR
jgi:predicted nucleic acid-binding protein